MDEPCLRTARTMLWRTSGWPKACTGVGGAEDCSSAPRDRVLFNSSASRTPGAAATILCDCRTTAFSAAARGACNEMGAATAMQCDSSSLDLVRGRHSMSVMRLAEDPPARCKGRIDHRLLLHRWFELLNGSGCWCSTRAR